MHTLVNAVDLLYPLVTCLLCVLIGGFAGYWLHYAKQKGQNLATKEDLKSLTEIPEQIKAAIANQSWDRQRQLDMKRDAVYETLKSLAFARLMLIKVITLSHDPESEKSTEEWVDSFNECSDAYLASLIDLYQKRFLSSIFTGPRFAALVHVADNMFTEASEAKDDEPKLLSTLEKLSQVMEKVKLEARVELDTNLPGATAA